MILLQYHKKSGWRDLKLFEPDFASCISYSSQMRSMMMRLLNRHSSNSDDIISYVSVLSCVRHVDKLTFSLLGRSSFK